MPSPTKTSQAILAELQGAQPITPTPYEMALLATITVLTQQVASLQEQMGHQEQVIEDLLTRLRQPRPIPTRQTAMPQPSVPKIPRSMEYWLTHIPEYGDELSPNDIAAFLTKPRVRPEDISIEPIAEPPRQRYTSIAWNIPAFLQMLLGALILMCIVCVWLMSYG